jgi:hypothetical protein
MPCTMRVCTAHRQGFPEEATNLRPDMQVGVSQTEDCPSHLFIFIQGYCAPS